MNLVLLAEAAAEETVASVGPSLWERLPAWWPVGLAAICLAVGLWLMVPPAGKFKKIVGALFVAAAAALFLSQAPLLVGAFASAVFWILAFLAVAPAVAAISVRDPVYSALWFALCLLGVAGLFLYQGAFFLGIATVAVYAGAIVVTFLFVLMLAQPAGHAFYDRMGWGKLSAAVACLATASLVAVLVHMTTGLQSGLEGLVATALESQVDSTGEPLIAEGQLRHVRQLIPRPTDVGEPVPPHRIELLLARRQLTVAQRDQITEHLSRELEGLSPSGIDFEFHYVAPADDVLAANHVAHLGDQLFGPRLIGVEVAGALLLAALVGAVAIATRGDHPHTSERGASA